MAVLIRGGSSSGQAAEIMSRAAEKTRDTMSSDPEFQRIMRRLRNARTKTVVHQETCPCCGAKLVNLYRKSTESGEWRCRKCWEKEENK